MRRSCWAVWPIASPSSTRQKSSADETPSKPSEVPESGTLPRSSRCAKSSIAASARMCCSRPWSVDVESCNLQPATCNPQPAPVMFTGIVEETGTVERIQPGAKSIQLIVRARVCGRGLKGGDSVAVNGCCLTAVKITPRAGHKLVQFDLL